MKTLPLAAQKTIAVRVPKVSIEAVRNGYRVTVPWNDKGDTGYLVSDGNLIRWAYDAVGRIPIDSKKPEPIRVSPSGEYVFPDFASLTTWLRKNITHGGGVVA